MNTSQDNDFKSMPTDFLFTLLQQCVEQENSRVDDVHSLIIDARARCEKDNSNEAPLFAVLDRVLEPAGARYMIEGIIGELHGRIPGAKDTNTDTDTDTETNQLSATIGEPA